MTETVTVLGAGLAGALVSVYLARRGLDVRLLERRADPRGSANPGGRSINLALANRGIRALSEVGLYKAIDALTVPMRGRMLHETGEAPVLQPYGKDESEVIYSISRAGLNALLLDRAQSEGVRIEFEKTVSDVDLRSGTLTISNADDTHERIVAAPIVAADGAGSVIRRAMSSHPGATGSEEFSEHGYKELTIPAGADGDFQLDPNALHIWPRGGFMLIALPNLDKSFTVTLFLPREGEHSFASLTSPAAVLAFFNAHFADAVPLFDDLADDYFSNPTGRMVTVRCRPWHVADKAVLIGDAAHAIVPFHGQGMNCAFEDCFELQRCLAEEGACDWANVFARFEARRRPNADAIADMAIENYTEMRESVRSPYFHLKKALAFELERRWPGLFVPRYSLVMFHHVPYSEAQRRGAIQQAILDELLAGHDREGPLGEVDWELAERLINERLA